MADQLPAGLLVRCTLRAFLYAFFTLRIAKPDAPVNMMHAVRKDVGATKALISGMRRPAGGDAVRLWRCTKVAAPTCLREEGWARVGVRGVSRRGIVAR